MKINKEEGAEQNHDKLPICLPIFEPGPLKYDIGGLPTRPRCSFTLILNYIYSV
jgi:hypothetical protein